MLPRIHPSTHARSHKVNGVLLGQYNTEAILRRQIARLGGAVEYGTELRSLKQHPDFVEAGLVTKVGDTEKTETGRATGSSARTVGRVRAF